MTQLFAQPYDISANGFYFENGEEFTEKSSNNRNAYGDPVEEYEIQFIDGDAIDCALAEAIGIHQGNFNRFFEIIDQWSDDEKLRYILAVGECGHDFDINRGDPGDLDVDIYHLNSMRELAEEFVAEGLFGDIPGHLIHYINYDAVARDLAVDYTETEIAGDYLIYRAG
ncbi:antirestriction protein ArdA [Sulfitobacter pacificus]|uniref:antirestriction protein ArdA n=1 Tax=Sulfitobacter pacificus TaxID=1499314 RepID=UPI00310AC5D7